MTASETTNIAIVLASGGGSRFRADIPKQFMKVAGKTVLEHTLDHEAWEVFSRERLAAGGALRKYYPLSEEGRAEYEVWRARK